MSSVAAAYSQSSARYTRCHQSQLPTRMSSSARYTRSSSVAAAYSQSSARYTRCHQSQLPTRNPQHAILDVISRSCLLAILSTQSVAAAYNPQHAILDVISRSCLLAMSAAILDVISRSCLLAIVSISWRDDTTNKEVVKRTGVELLQHIVTTIRFSSSTCQHFIQKQ